MIDIVIDIETLGTRPGCVILEVGACAINPHTGVIVSNFSRRLDEYFRDPADGRKITTDMIETINWWHHPDRFETYQALLSRGARGIVLGSKNWKSPYLRLFAFRHWMMTVTAGHDPEAVRVWGNGPTFDLAILQSAFDRYVITLPWSHTQERCVRTALEQAGYEKGSTSWMERGPRHRALNDARHEARKLYYAGALGEVSAIIKRLHQRGTLNGEGK